MIRVTPSSALTISLCVCVSFLFAQGPTTPWTKYPESNNAFAFDMYRYLSKEKGNLFFSPYSISSALAMTYAGARDNTEKQMAEVLRFPSDQALVHPELASLATQLNDIQNKGDVELHIANALWAQQGYEFVTDYLDLTKKYYSAALNYVDFEKAVEAARKKINKWVEDKTNDKIKNLIKPGGLNDLTRLVLTNAIYFKGNWLSPFEEQSTQDDSFWLSTKKSIKVPMMLQIGEFKYTENGTLKVLEMPYRGGELSMIVLLPKEVAGMARLEKELSSENLSAWISSLHQHYVAVHMPKFKMTKELELSGTLSSMGMPDAFSSNADFSGMDGKKWLFISAVIHKAFVDVNEKGTEAAAATAVVMECIMEVGPSEPPKVFRADHPFIFVIRHNESGAILFFGRVIDPTAQGK